MDSLSTILGFSLLACTGLASAHPHKIPDMSDSALIKHIKSSDFVFRSVLDNCSKERVSRKIVSGKRTFQYRADCEIKPKPETDCQSYRVEATGTVDTPEWATVRAIRLKLECSA
jgi:hypothetical protein